MPLSPDCLVAPLEWLRLRDDASVGAKNANLGEMLGHLSDHIQIPPGCAVTVHAWHTFLRHEALAARIEARLHGLGPEDGQALVHASAHIRAMIAAQPWPATLECELRAALSALGAAQPQRTFAVRASIPGAQRTRALDCAATFLNVCGIEAILHQVRAVFASLYQEHALGYRLGQDRARMHPDLAVGIQRMVCADTGTAGVVCTTEPESGFADVVCLAATYGLGAALGQGVVQPDRFYVHKPMLRAGHRAVIRRHLGSKLIQMHYAPTTEPLASVMLSDVPTEARNRYCLREAEVEQLAHAALRIEAHYGCPMHIEWCKDGADGQVYILQAQPQVPDAEGGRSRYRYKLRQATEALVQGRAIGQQVVAGPVRTVPHSSDLAQVQNGDVLVTDRTDPSWEPVMRRAAAIVTNRGGRTSHSALIARELGIPAVVGCRNAFESLKDGMLVTVVCNQGDTGLVYDGLLESEPAVVPPTAPPACPVPLMLTLDQPQLAFDYCRWPNAGVGLARLERIIN